MSCIHRVDVRVFEVSRHGGCLEGCEVNPSPMLTPRKIGKNMKEL